MHENAIVKNCGMTHLHIPPIKLPSILDGIENMLINITGFKIKFFTPRYFEIILIFKRQDRVIEEPMPIMSAFIPKNLGKNIIESSIKMLPKI